MTCQFLADVGLLW